MSSTTEVLEAMTSALQRMEARIDQLERENAEIKSALNAACSAIEDHEHPENGIVYVTTPGGRKTVCALVRV